MPNHKRTAREIKVVEKLLNNKNINIKIGTVENRDGPETIYIFVSFWMQPKEEYKNKEQDFLKAILEKELGSIYLKGLKPELSASPLFPKEKENIFIKNIPDNLNYNDKRNFISVELYLHTLNILNFNESNFEKIPLSAKKNTKLYSEAVRIGNIIGDSDIIMGKSLFDVYKKSI